MELRLGVTVYYFLWSLLSGFILAFVYDFFRSKRRIVKTSVIGVNLEDIIFFMVSSVLFFWIAYAKNNGIIRLQGFIGFFAGFWIYRMLFRDIMVRIMIFFTEIIVKFVVLILRVFLFPIRVAYGFLAKPFLVIGWYSRRGLTRAESVLRTIKNRKRMIKKAKNQTEIP